MHEGFDLQSGVSARMSGFRDLPLVSRSHTRRNDKYFIQSTIIASLGALWVPKEAKFFREVNIFGLVRCFSVKIE